MLGSRVVGLANQSQNVGVGGPTARISTGNGVPAIEATSRWLQPELFELETRAAVGDDQHDVMSGTRYQDAPGVVRPIRKLDS